MAGILPTFIEHWALSAQPGPLEHLQHK